MLRHPPGHKHAQAYGGIDVTARDRADAVGHRHQRKSEGKGDPRIADLLSCHHRRPTTEKYQRESADELRDVLFHVGLHSRLVRLFAELTMGRLVESDCQAVRLPVSPAGSWAACRSLR